MSTERRHVLITGGGSGIGRALAIEAMRRGFDVALCGRRRSALEETVGLLPPGSNALVFEADLTRASDRAGLIAGLGAAWGRLDVLINNAGVVIGGEADRFDDPALERTFHTNVFAPMALTRDLMPLLSMARPSRVVNVGSVFGEIAYPGFAAYSASKFALRGFSDALRREWRASGIGVTYAAPRATRTRAADAFHDLVSEAGMVLDDPARVARDIWVGVEAGRDRIPPPGAERLFVLVQRLAPSLVDRMLASNTAGSAPISRSEGRLPHV